MKKRIAACIPNPDDAGAYYRMTAPLSHLERFHDEYRVMTLAQVSMPIAQFFDLAVFQRPCSQADLGAMFTFKRLGIPVVVDFDDLLLEVPTDNPSYFAYADPQLRSNMFTAMELADAITVSTNALQDWIQKVMPQKKVVVLPNAVDERRPNKLNPEESNTVLWRGTRTHERDLYTFKNQLEQIEEKITYFGFYPWFIDNEFIAKAPVNPITEYFAKIYALNPKFGIVPLHDSLFNRCKSNIAWLEMAWAGAVCLVPDWEEWNVPGAITYESPEHFLEQYWQMIQIIPEEISSLRNQAWDTIQRHYTLAVVNEARHRLYQSL